MTCKFSLLVASMALLSLLLVPNSDASSVRSKSGSITFKNGVSIKVTGSRVFNVRRIKGKVRHMAWSYQYFQVTLPDGVHLHRKSTLQWSGNTYFFKGYSKVGKDFLAKSVRFEEQLNRKRRYTNTATFTLLLKGPKSKMTTTFSKTIKWALVVSMKRFLRVKYKVTEVKPNAKAAARPAPQTRK